MTLRVASMGPTNVSLDRQLSDKRTRFLRDFENGDSRKWIIVMGNEAGDLDSLASSIAYSHFASNPKLNSESNSNPRLDIVPLQLTPRSDLYLRPENLESLKLSNISPDSLLTIDDLYSRTTASSSASSSRLSSIEPTSIVPLLRLESNYVLVDHNSLLPMFRAHSFTTTSLDQDTGDNDDDKRVIAIIDHHVDERQHLGSASPRIIDLVGSCASLVTNYFLRDSPLSATIADATNSSSSSSSTTTLSQVSQLEVSRELADLLIGSILIDTKLKPVDLGGKATPIDLEAVSKLLPFSSFGEDASRSGEDEGKGATTVQEDDDDSAATVMNAAVLERLKQRGKRLEELKEDVSWMKGRDLLRRDYKEYLISPTKDGEGEEEGDEPLRYGLSTVPLGLNVWLDQYKTSLDDEEEDSPSTNEVNEEVEGVLEDIREWMKERRLRLCGVLTSYTHVKKKSGKPGKHRRELLILTNEVRFDSVVFPGLEQDPILQLEEWKEVGVYGGRDQGVKPGKAGDGYERWKVWQQGNTKATRKQVAPVLKELVTQALSR